MNSSGKELERLESVMERLRGEAGCPWDRKQTHTTLRPYLLEEAYEVLEAVDNGSPSQLQEELGDLLLQVVFHAQIAREKGDFSLAGVIKGITEKLIRRHPHVFGGGKVDGIDGVMKNWDQIKAEEKKKTPASALDGIPAYFPALLRAVKVQEKASRLGFDWPDIKGPLAKVKEEIKEFRRAWKDWEKAENKKEREEIHKNMEEEFGDILFALVNVGRFLRIQPEPALNMVTEKFCRRFRAMEEMARCRGLDLSKMTLEEMDCLWEESKEAETDKLYKHPREG